MKPSNLGVKSIVQCKISDLQDWLGFFGAEVVLFNLQNWSLLEQNLSPNATFGYAYDELRGREWTWKGYKQDETTTSSTLECTCSRSALMSGIWSEGCEYHQNR